MGIARNATKKGADAGGGIVAGRRMTVTAAKIVGINK